MTKKSVLDDDFRTHLREELLKQQDRRAEHIKSKFMFIVALGGLAGTLQSVKFEEPLAVNLLIYSIPLVAALFDFYILGGEFAVKRIRSFLILQDLNHTSEGRWTTFLDTWPKDFMRRNRAVTTGFVDLACIGAAIGNLIKFHSPIYHWILFTAWCFLVVWLYAHLVAIEKLTRRTFNESAQPTSKVVTRAN